MTTKKPRQRDGQEFAGGKKLRKALKRLKARQANHEGKHATCTPGSMK